jgi:hypothetical protein
MISTEGGVALGTVEEANEYLSRVINIFGVEVAIAFG